VRAPLRVPPERRHRHQRRGVHTPAPPTASEARARRGRQRSAAARPDAGARRPGDVLPRPGKESLRRMRALVPYEAPFRSLLQPSPMDVAALIADASAMSQEPEGVFPRPLPFEAEYKPCARPTLRHPRPNRFKPLCLRALGCHATVACSWHVDRGRRDPPPLCAYPASQYSVGQ
jgi:hypothetical protein